MDFTPSDEQRMLVDTVRAFVEKELTPHEAEVERTNQVRPELIAEIRRKAKAAGLYAANMPEDLGGGGLDAVSMALVERELGRTSFALQYAVARPSNILRACKGEQIERYLLPAIRGERVECLALTEPGAGSDLRSMKTRAVRQGDHFVINGTKQKITSFLVDKGIPGFEVRMGPHSVSHRGFHHCELIFTDCRIHERQIL